MRQKEIRDEGVMSELRGEPSKNESKNLKCILKDEQTGHAPRPHAFHRRAALFLKSSWSVNHRSGLQLEFEL